MWGETITKTIYSWNFNSYGSTVWLQIDNAASSISVLEKEVYPCTDAKYPGLYLEGTSESANSKFRIDKSNGVRAYTSGGNVLCIPDLKNGDKIEVTGFIYNNNGSQDVVMSVSDNANLVRNSATSFSITMNSDGNLGIKARYYNSDANAYYSITSIAVTREIEAVIVKSWDITKCTWAKETGFGTSTVTINSQSCTYATGDLEGLALQGGSDTGWAVNSNGLTQGNGNRNIGILNLKAGDEVVVTTAATISSLVNGTSTNDTYTGTCKFSVTLDGTFGFSIDRQKYTTSFVVYRSKVLVAIEDCEAHETSSDFATYIEGLYDAGNLNTADDVYAAHTAWQIAQADAASSNDITKVIFDAGVSDFTRWNNGRSNHDQQYTGAPDNYYFDGWDNQASDGKQKIYGLPAGTYTIKVATRASATLTDKSKYNVWVSGGSANVSVLGNHIGNTGGVLGNGWNWTVLSFTLDAEADVEIGFYTLPGEGTGLWAGCDDWHLYKGTLSASATIGSTGWTTFASAYPLDLSNMIASTGTVTAYYASAVGTEDVTMTATESTGVAAGTGLMLKGTPGATITIPVAASGTAISGNKLVGCTSETVLGTNANYYVLVNNGGAQFQSLEEHGATIPAGKAYLNAAVSGARLSIVFDDATAIKAIDASSKAGAQTDGKYLEKGKIVIVKNGVKFNTNGQKIK